jgi:G:T-mismatch repair DNA endonuclease (very short patch repair protein)
MTKKKKLCGCGCGAEVAKNRTYVAMHCFNDPKYLKRLSEAAKVKVFTEEHRKNLGKAHLGKSCHTEEHKKEISEWSKELWKDSEHRAKMKERNRTYRHSKATRKKMSVARLDRKERLGYIVSPETRKKLGEISKKKWQDPEFREKTIKATFLSLEIFPNKPERKLRKILKKLFPGEYKYVGDGSVLIGHKSPDFMNINGKKKLIELFGDYWHSKAKTGLSKKEHRKQRQKHFRKYGYRTLVVWEHQLADVSVLERRLQEFHDK